MFEELGQIVDVGRAEHHLGRSADAEPGHASERDVLGIAAAHRRQALEQAGAADRSGHHCRASRAAGPCSAASSAGSALAQLVLEPAPRQTTRSPDAARPSTVAANAAGSVSGTTWRWPC